MSWYVAALFVVTQISGSRAQPVSLHSGAWHAAAEGCERVNASGCYELNGTVNNPGPTRTVTLDCGLSVDIRLEVEGYARSEFVLVARTAKYGRRCVLVGK